MSEVLKKVEELIDDKTLSRHEQATRIWAIIKPKARTLQTLQAFDERLSYDDAKAVFESEKFQDWVVHAVSKDEITQLAEKDAAARALQRAARALH